ncbi:antitoxin MazE family protein [Acidisphaera sp. S103]|uniref:antitoxin MazE family protein n=1 Tax=Acidisphaera sp. S103 TaxID=1747223 RepID=UPI001576C095
MAAIKTGAARVQRRRDKLRAAGLRPLQIWVPDTRAIGFAEECVRQARLIRQSENAESLAEDEAWAEESDITGWTA